MKITKMQLDILITPEGKDKNKVYNAMSLQIPNVVTQGNSVEHAKKRLQEALQLYFEEVPEEKKRIIQTIEVKGENTFPFLSRIAI